MSTLCDYAMTDDNGDSEGNAGIDTDDVLTAMSARYRRILLEYLLTQPDDILEIDEAATYIATETESDTSEVYVTLFHHHAPLLRASGIVDFDRRSGVVRYDGSEQVTEMIEAIIEFEAVE